ncbi:MAG: M24 family metallopeptidase [Planctomycetota bacterium]
MNYQSRREKLRKAQKESGINALLVTNFTNVTYLTGFTGDDSYLLLYRGGEVVLSDPRYTTQLEEECPDLELHIRKPGVSMLQALVRVLQWAKVGKLGVEADSITLGLRDRLAEKLPKLELTATSGLVETLRRCKDSDEVDRIRQAARQAEKAFGVLRASLVPDRTEKQLADDLEYQMRQFGARAASFPTIVAAGPRAALPHARPTNEPIGGHGFVLVDWGACEGLYHSDLTRVLVTGKISAQLERVYRVVFEAQQRAIRAIRPGVTGHDVDRVARSFIAKSGFGRRFGHGLGHGLGLEVHEGPRLAAKNDIVLQPGMVVTVEPGIYLPGWGGVRIEDDVLVTRKGHEVLTGAPKQLEEMIVR